MKSNSPFLHFIRVRKKSTRTDYIDVSIRSSRTNAIANGENFLCKNRCRMESERGLFTSRRFTSKATVKELFTARESERESLEGLERSQTLQQGHLHTAMRTSNFSQFLLLFHVLQLLTCDIIHANVTDMLS